MAGREVDPKRPMAEQLIAPSEPTARPVPIVSDTDREKAPYGQPTTTVTGAAAPVIGRVICPHGRACSERRDAVKASIAGASEAQLWADRRATATAVAASQARNDVQETYERQALEGGLALIDAVLRTHGRALGPSGRNKGSGWER